MRILSRQHICKRATVSRRREYPGGDGDDDN